MRKHLPKLIATAKGHLKQDRQNIRSTKLSIAASPLVIPIHHAPPVQSHQVFVDTVKLTGKVSTDQTGRFPVTSIRGSKYLMVLYNLTYRPMNNLSLRGFLWNINTTTLCMFGLYYRFPIHIFINLWLCNFFIMKKVRFWD